MGRLLLAALFALAGRPVAGPDGSAPVPEESRQLVLVLSEDWTASRGRLTTWERSSARHPWGVVRSELPVALGRSGLGWGRGLHPLVRVARPLKREGDGRSPAGVFDLRLALGEAAAPLPSSQLPYRQSTPTLRCVDDPRSPHYNALVDTAVVAPDWSSAESMRRPDELYRHVVWVGHNDRPVRAGAGSCIFLHLRADPSSATAGCTALGRDEMEALLRWLDPALRPVLVQLPRAEHARLRALWALPPVSDADQGAAAER